MLEEEKVEVKSKGVIKLLIVLVLTVVIVMGYNITKVKEPKATYLDSREYNKQEMVDLVEGYITTVDKSRWENRVNTTRFKKSVIEQIYGTSFESFKLPEVGAYKFIDVQYTVNETTNYKMYLSVIIESKGKKEIKVFLASVEQDEIVHLEVY